MICVHNKLSVKGALQCIESGETVLYFVSRRVNQPGIFIKVSTEVEGTGLRGERECGMTSHLAFREDA